MAGRQAHRRRLYERHLRRRDADVVLPGRSFQLHGLCRQQRPGRVPFAQPEEDPFALLDRTIVNAPVIDSEQDPPASGGLSVHVRCDGDGQPAGELLRRQKP